MSEMKTVPIAGRSLWTRDDFSAGDWINHLHASDIADLEAALAGVKARGLGCGDFDCNAFPLPVFGQRLASMREELIHGRGFALLRGLPVERLSLADIETIYWGIGTHLGTAITQNDQGDVLTHVTMHLSEPGQLAARGYQDRRYQEPHNDRADLVGLLCVRTARSGGASSIVNSASLYNDILRNHPEYLPVFYRGFRLHRGGTVVTDEPVKVFSYFMGKVYVWFSSRNIERAVAQEGPLTAIEQAAFDYLSAIAMKPQYRLDMELQPGDIQFVSNYTVLHSRTAYEDFEERERWRLLLRLWLNLEDQPLEPAFAKFTRRTVYPERPLAGA